MKSAFTFLRNKTVSLIKDSKNLLQSSSLPQEFIHADVPYFCQWESRELAKDFLDHTLEPKDDPRWKESGAHTKEEYTDWSWSGCGMACTKMLLAHASGKIIPLVTLGKLCLTYGGYKEPLTHHAGLYYRPYTEFIHTEFGLNAHAHSALPLSDILKALSRKAYVIASVTPEIRTPETKPTRNSGHLILLLGYDLKKKCLYFHNPSGTTKSNQEYVEMSFKKFKQFYSQRGIIINK